MAIYGTYPIRKKKPTLQLRELVVGGDAVLRGGRVVAGRLFVLVDFSQHRLALVVIDFYIHLVKNHLDPINGDGVILLGDHMVQDDQLDWGVGIGRNDPSVIEFNNNADWGFVFGIRHG
jgi:hypothetical protein